MSQLVNEEKLCLLWFQIFYVITTSYDSKNVDNIPSNNVTRMFWLIPWFQFANSWISFSKTDVEVPVDLLLGAEVEGSNRRHCVRNTCQHVYTFNNITFCVVFFSFPLRIDVLVSWRSGTRSVSSRIYWFYIPIFTVFKPYILLNLNKCRDLRIITELYGK